ncbi:hypothetical protein B0I35DRAFT_192433 [Stachybotrys elegans]|uniref:Uncharacterized protein n=1 Tax=Stachybotrys elegans TaxID=80388 RepID=A0A8K0SWP8_9HYPO|nr:hypothetical protein B0I35DRAFT_192433 [Stachybotrys elegans]
MASVVSYSHSSFPRPMFSLPHRRSQQRSIHPSSPGDEEEQRMRSALRVQAAEENSVARARAYIDDFLQKSPWSDQLDQISVRNDLLPTMEELETYGDLDKTEGTRACSKLFKAVVVWDDLGLGLWERLHTASEQKKAALKGLGPMLRMGSVGDQRSPTAEMRTPPLDQLPLPEISASRRGSDQSSNSVSSKHSRTSAHSLYDKGVSVPRIIRTFLRRKS